MECVPERLHLPYVFKNALQRTNWKDESAKWSHQGLGSPTSGFRGHQGLIPLRTPHCSHWAVLFLSPKLSVSLLLFLFIWLLQSLSSIATQILFSCTWFSISSLSPFSVMKCYGQCCPGTVQLWKRHHLITLHVFCWQHVKGRKAQCWLKPGSRKHREMALLLFWILQSYLLLSAVLQFLASHHKCMVSLCYDSKSISINISLNALSFPLSEH